LAQHLWDTKNLRPVTIKQFNHVRNIVIEEFGYPLSDANAIALYVMERKRQQGKGITMGCSSAERGREHIDNHSRRLIRRIKESTIEKYKELWQKMNLESERE